MKLQNVYVGELLDIRKGAIYCDVREACKVLMRPHAPGVIMTMTYLPDAENYWIAGVVTGQMRDLQYNAIFTSSSEAEKRCDLLVSKGFPKSIIVCRELKINTRAEVYPDIKTEDHFKCERDLARLQKAFEAGLHADNTNRQFTLQIGEDGHIDQSEFGIIDFFGPDWTTVEAAKEVLHSIGTAYKLLKEIAVVNPDEQPNKWYRLQKQAAEMTKDYTAEPNPDPSVDQ
jgi:hypothetical protein